MFKFTIIKRLYVINTNMYEFKQTFVAYKFMLKKTIFLKKYFTLLEQKN